MNIGMKYCGHCRPFLDMTALPDLLSSARPDLHFVDHRRYQCDIILKLNACPSECASSVAFSGPQLSFVCRAEDQGSFDRVVQEILLALDAVVLAGT